MKKHTRTLTILTLVLSLIMAYATPISAADSIPNWESLYKSKIQQIENEYTQGKRTKDSTYNTLFFSLQDFNFDGVPELYHTLINTSGEEYQLQEGTEEVYYIKNNKVVLGKIGNHQTLGLLPAKTYTASLYDRRGQFVMYNQSSDIVSFITKDSWSDKSDGGKVTLSELKFDEKKGMLTVNELLSGTYKRGAEPSQINGYLLIDVASTYSKCNDKNHDMWSWDAPYIIIDETESNKKPATQTTTTSWKDAYEKFILDKGYANTTQKFYKTNESNIKFALHDFDGDSIPEIIVKNGSKNEKEMANYIYAYRNNKIVYVGKAGEYEADFMYVTGYPGLVWTSGLSGKYTSYYYSIKNEKLVSELVMEETINYVNNQMDYSYTQKTKDDELYNACKNSGRKLNMYNANSINIKGWTVFVSESVKNSGLFTDVNANSWFYDAVKFVTDRGIMSGVSSELFDPESAITRGMFITMLYRLEGEPNTKKANFKDVENNSWYASSIAWATQKGIANGVSETMFAPNDNITREQLMVFLYRYAKQKNKGVSASKFNIKKFFDNKYVATYAEDAMNWAIENNLISGTGKYYLEPSGNATRAQAAIILQRFCDKYKL